MVTLNSDELNRAETSLLKTVEKESFTESEDKDLKALQCILNSNGFLQMKSRIAMSGDSRKFRYPVISPL